MIKITSTSCEQKTWEESARVVTVRNAAVNANFGADVDVIVDVSVIGNAAVAFAVVEMIVIVATGMACAMSASFSEKARDRFRKWALCQQSD
jgi:hypothetical protein